MKILVLNCGSSSVKYKLFNMDTHEVLAQGGVEKLGLPGSFLKFTQPDGKKVILEKEMPEHNAAIEFILSVLTDDKYGCIKSFNEIDAVGHRVVRFRGSHNDGYHISYTENKADRTYKHNPALSDGKQCRTHPPDGFPGSMRS